MPSPESPGNRLKNVLIDELSAVTGNTAERARALADQIRSTNSTRISRQVAEESIVVLRNGSERARRLALQIHIANFQAGYVREMPERRSWVRTAMGSPMTWGLLGASAGTILGTWRNEVGTGITGVTSNISSLEVPPAALGALGGAAGVGTLWLGSRWLRSRGNTVGDESIDLELLARSRPVRELIRPNPATPPATENPPSQAA